MFASGALGLSALWGNRSSVDAVALNALINRLGLASIGATGLWIGLVSRVALHRGRLPRQLSYLGLVLGSVSLVTFALPSLALLVLVLGGCCYLWLGLPLRSSTRDDMAPDRRVRRSSRAL